AANSDHTNTTTTWPRKKKPANGNRPAHTANTRHGHSDHQRSDRRQLIGPTTGETMALTKSQLEEINQALQPRIAHLAKQNHQLRAANEQLIARTEALTNQTETLAAQLRQLTSYVRKLKSFVTSVVTSTIGTTGIDNR